MGARDKLNGVVVGACLFISALFGAAMGSWGAFWIILVVMIVGSSGAGGIRTQPGAHASGARRGGGGGRHSTRFR
jgi:hypothetical protein